MDTIKKKLFALTISILAAAFLISAPVGQKAFAGSYYPVAGLSYTSATEACFLMQLDGYVTRASATCSISDLITPTAADTVFNMTNPSGSTCRYTFDSGTDPAFTVDLPGSYRGKRGTIVVIQGSDFSAGNNGTFITIASGTDYFEVTNSGCVVEASKQIKGGSIQYRRWDSCLGGTSTEWVISEPVADTARYTWSTVGTTPDIASLRLNDRMYLYGAGWNANNTGYFTLTAVGATYFEITNASVVAETVTLGNAGSVCNLGI